LENILFNKNYGGFFMKNYGLVVLLIGGLLASCASLDIYMPLNPDEEVIGSIQTNFYSMTYIGAGRIDKSNQQQAYIELMKAARNIYQGNIDIRNIIVSYVGINIEHGNEFTASGIVVLLNNGTGNSGIGNAIAKTNEALKNKLSRESIIAVLNISYQNDAIVARDEIEYELVRTEYFNVVDRKTLDRIKDEQNFQLSGDVDDKYIVGIGELLGANIVITIDITDTRSIKRLITKAVDVRAGKIITMVMEQY
jgi:hypothetical protein